jgi:polysaccharide export outer membrane protein
VVTALQQLTHRRNLCNIHPGEETSLFVENRKWPRSLWSIQRFVVLVATGSCMMLPIASPDLRAQQPTTAENPPKSQEKSTPKADSTAQNAPGVDPNTYHIGLDDQLMISVWKEPELSSTVVVRPDGMITLPLINDVHVVGMKPTELQQLLIEKLKPFVSVPQVTVIVQGIKSRKVFLVGQVGKQGEYQLEGGETVLQLLAAAGGMGPFAKSNSIYILRTVNGKQVRLPFQFKKALQGHSGKDDIPLEPGDVVVVP